MTTTPPTANPDILAHAQKLREAYISKAKTDKLNALILGDKGSGKTTLATTCPKPVVIDCFDSNGTSTRALRPFIERGDIIVNDFSGDRWRKATKYENWVAHFEQMQKINFFNHIGTYMLDSLTSFSKSMAYRVVQMSEQNRQAQYTLSQQGFRIMLWKMMDMIEAINALPCHTIVTGHVDLIKDPVNEEMHTALLLPGKQSFEVPTAFCEMYIARVDGSSAKAKHYLQVKNNGKWHAETRLGGDKFDMQEPPDIKKLLIKAGVDASDKPSLFDQSQQQAAADKQ